MADSDRNSVLIVGCGSIGERHLRCFQATGRVEVTACDSNPALLQQITDRYRAPGASSWEAEIASGRHHAVVICTPAPLHVPIALQALRRGLHVLIEKPLSHSLAGVDDLLAAEKQSRAQAAVAYVQHVFPFLCQARDFLRAGSLGPVRHVSGSSGQPFYRLRPGYERSYYRDRALGGGAIQDGLTHGVNWVESVVGPVDSVLCDCAHQVIPGVEVEDTVLVAARHGAVLASYSLNQFQLPSENYLQFNAEHGSVRIEYHRQRWGVWTEGAKDWAWNEVRVPDRDSHFTAQANAFLDQIEGRPARLCSLNAAAQTLRFNLAALASAASGTRVHCRDVQS